VRYLVNRHCNDYRTHVFKFFCKGSFLSAVYAQKSGNNLKDRQNDSNKKGVDSEAHAFRCVIACREEGKRPKRLTF
jgi:hypothetical protein